MQPVVLITGSRKGIGRFLAEHYIAKGFSVIGCSRKPSDLTHQSYSHFCLDVGDPAAVRKFFASPEVSSRGIDFLLNNAGVAGMNHSLLMPAEQAVEIMQTNFFGTYFFSTEAARLMMKRKKGGRIVNFTSIVVPLELGGHALYTASKAAVECLTRILAKEYAPFGITVNGVGPGVTATDLTKSIPAEKIASLRAMQAIPRDTSPEDILNVVDFFLRPESGFVTGQITYLGGI
ncbi:MAG: SDR family NAD(P)-dependent oxidoreductase [Bdellovibrionota bacterium]